MSEKLCNIKSYRGGVLHSTDIADNLTTEDEGKVLDARQGKALNDQISSINTSLTQSFKIARLITNRHYEVSGASSTFHMPYMPIDCGLIMVSMHSTNTHDGGVFIYSAGYLFAKISESLHNNGVALTLDGSTDDPIISYTFPDSNNNGACISVCYLSWNYSVS